jgi:hypothetical protein
MKHARLAAATSRFLTNSSLAGQGGLLGCSYPVL